ncbi:response regulator [uncultured Methanoregula sp.]|uniref:response regulator n=1 Tax=uncultured Methanoregula sp. TaxID=1005933 RepID=UPI002AAB05CC|nr:response regulator [uncultured Methanoregula sp.]
METSDNKMITILLVEDSRTQAEYLRHILENDGYRVTLTDNGSEALAQIGRNRPSIILSDIVMPEMDGYELCSRVKQNPKTADIPVILVTQLFDPVDVIRGLESGADDFIIKPFDPEYVQLRICNILKTVNQPDPDGPRRALTLTLFNKTHTIPASRVQILSILLSTYEVAVRKNAELEEARERLNAVNEQLQQAIADLKQSNTRLEQENTERRRVEKALDEANKKLNLMASITRHDVINQLTSQHESLENALLLRAKDPEKAWEHVTSAAAIATRTLNSVKFTGDYQKIGVKSPQWQDIHTLIQAAEKDTSPGGLTFSNGISPGTEIFADPLIGKVFSNLIENTVKYGKKATSIRFSLHAEADGMVIICEDDGVGIPDGRKEKIFSYEHGMSHGLGLFLAREILAITSITLRETGTAGSGARFELRCPSTTTRAAGQPAP